MTPSTLHETLALQLRYTHGVVNRNLEGLTEDDARRLPPEGGSSANWVLGHVVHARNGMLAMMGRDPVLDPDVAARYARGSAPGDEPASLSDLLAAFNAAQEGLLAALPDLSETVQNAPAPFSPTRNPDETVGSLLAGLLFHEAYHAGQLGVLRRRSGRPGAIA